MQTYGVFSERAQGKLLSSVKTLEIVIYYTEQLGTVLFCSFPGY